jgi:Protein of unknown function (DUF1553)/Protein of unknown function (DUF1549)
MNRRLYNHKTCRHSRLRQTPRNKTSLRLIFSQEFPTRLGTAHALFLVGLLALGAAPALSQEDVAETKVNLQIDTTPITEAPITDADRAHWAFAPIQRHPLPPTKQSAWLRNPIDAFILNKLESNNIRPANQADRATLLRRLTFDLTGLPPTPADLTTFEADKAPDAYERQLDRLLASPAFGERYAQYWLDLARFAETDGYEHDKLRPDAWRYRDWLIAALNADLPYDDFIRLQLAGDEIQEGKAPAEPPSSNPKSKIENLKSDPLSPGHVASMFCLSGPDMPDVNDQLERRHVLLNEMTATVGAVFLGLQLGCAQCHNHKYDPLSQADFYRLRAVFEPAVAMLKRDVPFSILANQKDPPTPRFWIRGDHRRPGLEVPPAFPRIATATPLPLGEGGERSSPGEGASASDSALRIPHTAISTIRSPRTELAEWLVHPSNPLTSRVIANRLWQSHFSRGLCATPSDFGTMGGAVTHPELLDHLATDLLDHAWNLKRLHRAILSSSTYRQSSDNLKSKIQNLKSPDPDNTLYSHFPRQRLSGEAIRDSLLAAAGLLTSERGGPGVMPRLPDELLGTLLKGQWTTSKLEADHYKRSIYVFARRNLRYPIFEAFDRPDGNATCPIRNRSTTAPQSLLLFNSELSLLAARHLAGRIMSGATKPREQIEQLYLIALSRRPTATETATLEKFLADQQRRLAAESRPRDDLALPLPCPESKDHFLAAALVDACLALLNSSEFIYVD